MKTVTVSCTTQPFSISTTYVVVTVGFAVGFGQESQLNVLKGVQLYVPPPVTSNGTGPLQTVVSFEMVVTGGSETSMMIGMIVLAGGVPLSVAEMVTVL